MAEVVMKVATPTQRARAKMKHLQDMHKRPGVRVEPAGDPSGRNQYTADDMRKYLKHPRGGAFRSEGSIEWPNDTFTQRRLREGCIKLAEAKENGEQKPARHHHRGGDA